MLKTLETTSIRIIVLIPALAFIERVFSLSRSLDEQERIFNQFLDYLKENGENKRKISKYKKYVNMLYKELGSYIDENGEYQYIFEEIQRHCYLSINEYIHLVYTPEFDISYFFLFRENYNLYKEKKVLYIRMETDKYLNLMKGFIQENYFGHFKKNAQ